MTDSIRPPATVEVTCKCGWTFWLGALDPRLPDGPFVCWTCSGDPAPTEKAEETP